MGSAVIGALRANLGLDSSKFQKGARGVRDPLRAMKKQFLAVSAVAAAFGGAITAAALRGADQIDKLAKASRRLDASIGGFRAVQLAADEAGISLSSLTNDVQTMNRELAKAGEGGPVDDALSALGLTAKELIDLDVDGRLALIADRMKELGLSSGQATAVLQDFGVRNREMALLMVGGGDAIRAARGDIQDYGLALNEVDSASIEHANDQISRLSIISERFGQQLALEIVPALGKMAEAFTNSMREGGLLRGIIDGVANNIKRLGTYAAVAVTILGVRLVGSMALAATGLAGLSAGLVTLRGALIRTGFGALIVGIGELVYQFGELSSKAGGFGEAMGLLKDVAVEVWERIKMGGQSLADGLSSVYARIKAGWLTVLAGMQKAWSDFLHTVTRGLANVPGMDGPMLAVGNAAIMAGSAWIEMRGEAEAARAAADGLVSSSREMAAAAAAPLKSMQALRDVMANTGGPSASPSDPNTPDNGNQIRTATLQALLDKIDPARVAMRGLAADTATLDAALANNEITQEQYNASIAALPGLYEAVTASGGGAARATNEVTAAMAEATRAAEAQAAATEKAKKAADGLAGTFASTFTDIFSGTKSAISALADLAGQLGKMALMAGFKALFNGALGSLSGGGAGLASIFGFNANGTEDWQGGLSLVGERGAELVNLPSGSQVFNAQKTAQMMKAPAAAAPEVKFEPKIINLFDMSVVGDWLAGPDGEAAILNIMSRNGVVGG